MHASRCPDSCHDDAEVRRPSGSALYQLMTIQRIAPEGLIAKGIDAEHVPSFEHRLLGMGVDPRVGLRARCGESSDMAILGLAAAKTAIAGAARMYFR